MFNLMASSAVLMLEGSGKRSPNRAFFIADVSSAAKRQTGPSALSSVRKMGNWQRFGVVITGETVKNELTMDVIIQDTNASGF
jgi:hypothetical protein